MKHRQQLRTLFVWLLATIFVSLDAHAVYESIEGTIYVENGSTTNVTLPTSWQNEYNNFNGFGGRWSSSNTNALKVTTTSTFFCTIYATPTFTSYSNVYLYYEFSCWQGINLIEYKIKWNIEANNQSSSLTLTATPAGGTVEKGTKVRLKASNDNALIFYTLDGSNPKTSNTRQSIPSDYPNGPVINETCTLKAFAEYIIDSDVYTWNYTVSPSKSIAIDATNFPDANFRNYLLEQSYGKDGVLTENEINEITSIEVYSKKISDLTGIEHFTALKRLRCETNNLTTLDISKNTALIELQCSNNKLTSLDVSKNTVLSELVCFDNILTELNVANNTELTYLHFANNQLTLIDVSKNTKLTKLWCWSNPLTKLDISKNLLLTDLNCGSQQISALDISKNTALISLHCDGCNLSSLDVSQNIALKSLYCGNNSLTTLDVSKNTALTDLSCYNNQLMVLNVSSNTALTSLACYDNQLTMLDVSKNTALTRLRCYNNQLSVLDVSKNTALTELWCYNNQLSVLDVSKNTALTGLRCYNNQLSVLDASKNTALTELWCFNNMIRGESMDILVNSLPNNNTNDKHTLSIIDDSYGSSEGNICTKNQVAVAKAKGWTVQKRSGAEYEGSDEDNSAVVVTIDEITFPDENFRNYLLSQSYGRDGVLTENEVNRITYLSVDNKNISSLKGVEYFTALETLYCYDNQLITLDVSKNTTLTNLRCSDNQLTTLDLSKNTALTSLNCSNNKLTTLDVSKNTALTSLSCGGNLFTVLDVSRNTALTSLGCYNSQLTTLDVSKNTALTSLSCYGNQLTTLDVSKNTALTNFVCHRNQIKGTSMDALINSLPQNNTNEECFFRVIYFGAEDGNVCTKKQVTAAKAKGWTPQYNDNGKWIDYEGSDDEPIQNIAIDETNFPDADFRNWLLNQEYGKDGNLTTVEIDEITHINVYNKNIRSLKGLEYFTALIGLNCRHNQLTSLDISMNTALTRLDCSDNQLTNLDVSNNIALTTIECYCNQIKKEAMDALISSLPQNTTSNEYVFCVVDDARYYDSKLDNICTKTQVSAAKAKGWIVTDAQWVVYEGSDDEPTKGTADNPFTPAEAYAYGSTLAANEQSQEDYYIRGMVVSIKEQFGTQYGNATFYISADGTEKDLFYIYRALYLENTKYAGQDQLLRVGDDVVVCGKITNYMGTLPETVQEKAYVVSINGNTSGINDVMIDGNKAAPIYNLNGQRVNTTKKGLYIINGKKVVVR